MKSKHIAALTLLSTLLVACIPASFEYYRPEGPGGKIISKACGTINAPKTTWQYQMGSVTLETAVGENREKQRGSFTLRLFVPAETVVSLKNKEISVRTVAPPKIQNPELKRLTAYKGTFKVESRKLDSLELRGDAKSDWVIDGREIIVMAAEMEFPLEQEIFVSLPILTVEGKPIQVPEIRFTREKGFAIYPINC